MRTLLVLTLCVAACGLPQRPGDTAAEETAGSTATTVQSADAVIVNGLPYDGCSYVIEVGQTQYAPDAVSRDLVVAFGVAIGKTPVHIDYRLTGATGQVECGWGSQRQLPEVALVSLTAR
jgi:hypothetical protein